MILTCRELTELVTEDREGALAGARRVLYRFHLSVCPACKAYVRGYEATLQSLNESEASVAPADVKQAALEALRAARR